MKSYVLKEYNQPLVLKDIPDPRYGDDDVIVKVLSAGACATDMRIYHGHLDEIIKLPQVQGHELSGQIVEIGKNVKNLKPGDCGIVYHYRPKKILIIGLGGLGLHGIQIAVMLGSSVGGVDIRPKSLEELY